MNDGGCDPYGRLLVRLVRRDRRGAGALFRLGPDDELSRELFGVHVSNGIVWATDGRTASPSSSCRSPG
jgi:sugar lactone lactonase YvrE